MDQRGASPTTPKIRALVAAHALGAFNLAASFSVALLMLAAAEGGENPLLERAGLLSVAEIGFWRMVGVFAAFVVPLALASLAGGLLIDRTAKRSLLIAAKTAELALLAAGTAALALAPSASALPLVVLGFLGVAAAVSRIAVHAALPEMVPHRRLAAAGGAMIGWAFVGLIGGVAVGGWLLAGAPTQPWIAGLMLCGSGLVGVVAAYLVTRRDQASRDDASRSREGHRPKGRRATLRASSASDAGAARLAAATLISRLSTLRGNRTLYLSALGLLFFWAIAGLLLPAVLFYGDRYLSLLAWRALALLGTGAVGVAAGSAIAAWLSGGKVEYGLIPLGSIGLTVFPLLQGLLLPGFGWSIVLMAGLGVSAALVLVPLNAVVQWQTPAEQRAGVIGLVRGAAFAGMALCVVLATGLLTWLVSPRVMSVAVAVLAAAGTVWALKLAPVASLRLVLVLLTRVFYRIRVIGRAHVPETGPALLVPNHVSFMDGLLVLASLDRPIRFVIEDRYFRRRLFQPFLKAGGAIPISTSGGPRNILQAFREAGRALDQGELVCIFAEGQITRTGFLLPFRRGLERIVKGRSAPIIPVHLDRMWGSIFSPAGARSKLPRRIPYPVSVSFGEPLPAETPLHEVRRAVHELGERAWEHRRDDARPLHHSFIRKARRHPRELAMADGQRPHVSRFKALVGTIALARALRAHWGEQETVGILLPPSVPAALVNIAASLTGRTAVNLNYTAGREGMESAARQAGLRTVVTNRTFLERAKLEMPTNVEPIWIEEVAAGITRRQRLKAVALALLAPLRLIERACGAVRRPDVDHLVTIIFSSGSTGEPKGVMLTHFNLDSNVKGAAQVFRLEKGDRILGILPLFHSFGYMATLWLAVNERVGVVYHPSPLDADMIGELVERYRITLLVTTPTFLQLYMRRCTPAQFGSLRLVVTGAEKLNQRLADAFEEYFGIRPIEGYGTTECAPVVAVGTLDFRAPGFYQPGTKRGTVGQPLPGVSVRIVDPDGLARSDRDHRSSSGGAQAVPGSAAAGRREAESARDIDPFAPLPPNTPGMLIVRGPNVMRGYLNRPDLTEAVLRDGWYITGDIATMDEEGFIRITDRLARFSKIGGEMVPHGRVEQALHEAAVEIGAAEQGAQVLAVTSIADERKGERLAVVHTIDERRVPVVVEKLAEKGLPNLFLPRPEHFVRVDALPVLGTGKLDLRSVKRIAQESLAGERGAEASADGAPVSEAATAS